MTALDDDEDDWARVATTVLRKDGYAMSSLKHPREKLLESSLRFLQLLCENHNLEMQVWIGSRLSRILLLTMPEFPEISQNSRKQNPVRLGFSDVILPRLHFRL